MRRFLQRFSSFRPRAGLQIRVHTGNGERPAAGRPSRDGVALIITLIMLSIITFMAVAFLVLSRREKGSVTTSTDQAIARLAADAALERAKVEALGPVLAFRNDQAFDFVVATNYINREGFFGNLPADADPYTNVNYEYDANGQPLAEIDVLQTITNLFYNPRAPVFVTNRLTGETEFRYYLDLNRNGRYDTNGYLPVFDVNGDAVLEPGSNTIVRANFIGDPEWIGVLEYPDRPHSSSNRFTQRYTYVVVPSDRTIDINYVFNQANNPGKASLNQAGRDYRRNQGLGSWEINLGAFLFDLNSNPYMWGGFPGGQDEYVYDVINSTRGAGGVAFRDALAIYRYRLNGPQPLNAYNLDSADLFITDAGLVFPNDGIDEYSDGPLMFGPTLINEVVQDPPASPWPGADNTNHFFTIQDFFDPRKTSDDFIERLTTAGIQTNSYDRYTYYRMLAQLGTDSAPESGKMNLNWVNVDVAGNIVPGLETNMIPWQPLQFFTNAAIRMLEEYNLRDGFDNPITLSSIPLYPTNLYTPAVHRILQVAANLYDATTNRIAVSGQTNAYFPSVFRPHFRSSNGVVYIAGYDEVIDPEPLGRPYLELTNVSTVNQLTNGNNIYGVPWVIGAKRGFPNFNELVSLTTLTTTRKLQLRKNTPEGDVSEIRQMYNVGLSNNLAIEAWNSYSNTYPRDLLLTLTNEYSVLITNEFGQSLIPTIYFTTNFVSVRSTNITSWPGFKDHNESPALSFIVPLQTDFLVMSNATYQESPPTFVPANSNFLSDASVPMPQIFVVLNNRVRYAVVDTAENRVIDYVNLDTHFSRASEVINLTAQLVANGGTSWQTNPITPKFPGVTARGIQFQIDVSAGLDGGTVDWAAAGADPSNRGQITKFLQFMTPGRSGNTNVLMQTPFNPTEHLYARQMWQANDPLVHYTINDLEDPRLPKVLDSPDGAGDIRALNRRYRPWPRNPLLADADTDFAISLKDPLVTRSDDWDFPGNRLPNVGVIGRIHRGTPWQTIYMKATNIVAGDQKSWTAWTGSDGDIGRDIAPVEDRRLFDIFTTSMHENATRGQVSANQTNLASWSAILSGLIVPTNSALDRTVGWTPVQPAGLSPEVGRIVKSINDSRTNYTLGLFRHVGDVLSAPELSDHSPFLDRSQLRNSDGRAGGISDAMMERIPQQIMSLLTLNRTPRFVVYSYGQTLRPAERSIMTSGPFFGVCTNYQVTAETATRAVLRVEGAPNNPRIIVEQFNVLPPD